MSRRNWFIWLGAALILALAWGLPASGALNPYVIQILMYVGINMILTLSLNLVNGYMGEFSVGHAGFMGIGAYVASVLTVAVLPPVWAAPAFPAVLVAGGAAAALAGLIVAYPSFRTRGDYLAIVTLAFAMIVKSAFENINAIGGPRGLSGIEGLSTMPWIFAWTVLSVWIMRNVVYSNPGRGVLAIGLYPFLAGDAVKIALAAILLPAGWKIIRYFGLDANPPSAVE